MQLAVYYFKNQCEMVHFNSFVYHASLAATTHSVLTGTQFLLAADMQHGVVKQLGRCSIDGWCSLQEVVLIRAIIAFDVIYSQKWQSHVARSN